MTNKRLILSHTTVAICTFMIGVLLAVYLLPRQYNLNIDQTTVTSHVIFNADITGVFANGTQIFHEQTHNTYTTIGKTFERDLKAFANVTQNATYGKLNWVSLSNDASPSASWTQLADEKTGSGAGRTAFDTCTVINVTSFNGTVTFTFSGTVTLQCAGIQWSSTASSNNNLYAAFAFTQTTFNDDDQLIIRYYNTESGT